MDIGESIFVAGHRGLVGSAVVRQLRSRGYENLVLRERETLDLTRQAAVEELFSSEKIDYVIIAAARVGGIEANRWHQADFLFENLAIATNIIHAAFKAEVKKLLFLGSACIYPRICEQPIKETAILTGPLESTNEGYAIAKIAGLKLTEMFNRQYGARFISAMPTNLYGENDNFDPTGSHVIPGMMRRFHEAKVTNSSHVVIWGDGTPRREFLHVDDLAEALFVLMCNYESPEPINIGCGTDLSIADLARLMKEITGFTGDLMFDTTKPGGTPLRRLNVEKMFQLGWSPKTEFRQGLQQVYQWACQHKIFDAPALT